MAVWPPDWPIISEKLLLVQCFVHPRLSLFKRNFRFCSQIIPNQQATAPKLRFTVLIFPEHFVVQKMKRKSNGITTTNCALLRWPLASQGDEHDATTFSWLGEVMIYCRM